jgi:hypothetical protein
VIWEQKHPRPHEKERPLPGGQFGMLPDRSWPPAACDSAPKPPFAEPKIVYSVPYRLLWPNDSFEAANGPVPGHFDTLDVVKMAAQSRHCYHRFFDAVNRYGEELQPLLY